MADADFEDIFGAGAGGGAIVNYTYITEDLGTAGVYTSVAGDNLAVAARNNVAAFGPADPTWDAIPLTNFTFGANSVTFAAASPTEATWTDQAIGSGSGKTGAFEIEVDAVTSAGATIYVGFNDVRSMSGSLIVGGLQLASSGTALAIARNQTNVSLGTYAATDVFLMEVDSSGTITIKKNTVLVHTFPNATTNNVFGSIEVFTSGANSQESLTINSFTSEAHVERGSYQIDLPASPDDNSKVRIRDFHYEFTDFNMTVGGNGKNILGSSDFTLNNAGDEVIFQFLTGADEWSVTDV